MGKTGKQKDHKHNSKTSHKRTDKEQSEQGPKKLKDPAKNIEVIEWVTKGDGITPNSYVSKLEKRRKSDKLNFRQRQIVFFQFPAATWVMIKHRHGTF